MVHITMHENLPLVPAIKRFNTAFLRDAAKVNELKIALNNSFQALQNLLIEEETTMKNNWKQVETYYPQRTTGRRATRRIIIRNGSPLKVITRLKKGRIKRQQLTTEE